MHSKTSKKANKNFWQTLSKPFFMLAPMANVTDFAFRQIITKYGKPDVMWTEFVSADGLVSRGKEKLLIDLKFSKDERPIVAQLFTGHPEVMLRSAQLVAELGFDGLDINMGCPDRAVEKQGGGAASIKSPKVAIEVIQSARKGWSEGGGCDSNSVTVKTRIGYNKIDLDWIRLLLEQKLPALTVHLRTRKEMSDVPAHWDLMPEIIKMRDEISPETLIIGNGDVESVNDGLIKIKESGCDGIMIGRGIFGKPWLFESVSRARKRDGFSRLERSETKGELLALRERAEFDPDFKTSRERLKIMLEHTKLFERTFCEKKHLKNFAVMKKHFKAYVSGWDGAKELRVKLMKTENFKQVKKVVDNYLAQVE
ncbi:MAG: tRNA-dihydrouridine synthase [Patescibacteria group bacterium]